MRYGGFWLRVIAYLIDAMIVIVLCSVVAGLLGGIIGGILGSSEVSDETFNQILALGPVDKLYPELDCGEMDESKKAVGGLVVACGNAP